jgi:hypothetical protein
MLSVVFKDPIRTVQKTLSVSLIKTSQLTLYIEVIALSSEIHTKQTKTLMWVERRIPKH